LFSGGQRLSAKLVLQGGQLATDRSAKETVITHLHKSVRQDMLEDVFYKLKSAQFIIEKVPTLKETTLKLLSKRGPLYNRKVAHFG
jgi:hypothetical protein